MTLIELLRQIRGIESRMLTTEGIPLKMYGKDFYEIEQALYYLNSIHVDYNELIKKGLAKRAS